jgi:group I intron endonuclease
LHITKNLKAAKVALSGEVGVYSIICNITGARYIGSSMNIGNRLVRHLVDNNTNEHLQNAIAKYGLENFTFAVVESCDLSVLLQREQHYLDILFSLPANLRYNFSPVAGAPIAGRNHTPETLVKLSVAQSGANNTMYGKSHTPETLAKMSVAKSGANHPMYGRTGALNPMYGKSGELSPVSILVKVYSADDNQLVRSFSSQVAVAQWLGINQYTVSAEGRYIKSGKVWNKLYIFQKSS